MGHPALHWNSLLSIECLSFWRWRSDRVQKTLLIRPIYWDTFVFMSQWTVTSQFSLWEAGEWAFVWQIFGFFPTCKQRNVESRSPSCLRCCSNCGNLLATFVCRVRESARCHIALETISTLTRPDGTSTHVGMDSKTTTTDTTVRSHGSSVCVLLVSDSCVQPIE